MKIWTCKIGSAQALPPGADVPMRIAIQEAFRRLTGDYPEFTFSGWGGELTEEELAVVEDRESLPTTEAQS